jgi:hypothetical protein
MMNVKDRGPGFLLEGDLALDLEKRMSAAGPTGSSNSPRSGRLAVEEKIVTSNEFRKMALDLPEVVESSHIGHPDFRVGGRIFATLGFPDSSLGMVKLTPDEQELFVQIEPEGFQPVKGGWGRQGATNVLLKSAKKSTVREALLAAWRLRGPKTVARKPAASKSPKHRPGRTR